MIDLYGVTLSLPVVRFGQLVRYADKRIVNMMKVHTVHRKEQLATIINTIQ